MRRSAHMAEARQGVTSMIFGEGPSAAPSDRFPTFHDYFETLLEQASG